MHVIVKPIDLVAQDIGERREPRVIAIARRTADYCCCAEDRDQRRAQLVRNRADQGIAQRFGLGADPRIAEGLTKIEVLQRGRRVGQNGVDSLPDGVGHLSRLLAKIDCQDAEIARLSGNGSNEPDATFAVRDDTAIA